MKKQKIKRVSHATVYQNAVLLLQFANLIGPDQAAMLHKEILKRINPGWAEFYLNFNPKRAKK